MIIARKTNIAEADKKRTEIIKTKSAKNYELTKKMGLIEKEHQRLRTKRMTSYLPSRASTSMSACSSSSTRSDLLEKSLEIQKLKAQLLAKKQSTKIQP